MNSTAEKKTDQIYRAFSQALFEEAKNDLLSFPHARPLLAHYTSISTLEGILSSEEIWFSNPLFMNDLQELRFGLLEGLQSFQDSKEIQEAAGSPQRYQQIAQHFDHFFDLAASEQVLDVYAFCASVHDEKEHKDGRLSMWRGYGGNGKGVAIVFDTKKINYVETGSPLIISRVHYASTEDRKQWLQDLMRKFAALLKENHVEDEHLYLPVHALFTRIKIFSLFTKHDGFKEEQEWRVVYLKEWDQGDSVTPTHSYAITDRGVEPKLKLPVKAIPGKTTDDFSISTLIYEIILGPSISSQLSKGALARMLDSIGKPELKVKLRASDIPYRA